jgi:hypothetical protein
MVAAMSLLRCLRACAAIIALGLAGCASLPGADPAAVDLTGLPPRNELDGVPFHAQETDQCGPAALAMVLSYSGTPRTPQQLAEQVFLPERHGSLQAEMLAAIRRDGRVAYPLAPDLADVLREVAAGNPVVVLQNVGSPSAPQWHYAVVVGYDGAGRELILRSGGQRRLVISWQAFMESWSPGGRWAVVALSPRQLPATAREAEFVAAAVSLERVAPAAAAEAYGAALQRWPQDLTARIGLGNVAYGMHRLGDAEAQYRRATEDHADAADAWNNLAQVLHDSGRDAEAATAAERAVAIGGPRLATYRATLEAITAAAPR